MSTINVTNLSGRGGATPNLPDGANITGVATATSFDGNLKSTGTPTLGLGVTINASGINVSGVLTATTFKGDGSSLTGVGESVAPWYYNPDVNDSSIDVDTGIGITFNKLVNMGSGTATIKMVNAVSGVAGTTIQSWGISSVTKAAVTEITLGSLVSPLTINKTYQLDIPEGFVKDSSDTNFVGTAWTFATEPAQTKLFGSGENPSGALGTNNLTVYSSPVQIPGIWSGSTGHVGTGDQRLDSSYFIKQDGTLWSWGGNSVGKLGLNEGPSTQRSSPTQIGSETTWNNVSKSYIGCFATKTDGTLWGWGLNEKGQLGQNSIRTPSGAGYSSPIQIGSDTTWSHVQGGYYNFYATKTNGTLWGCGYNHVGYLGQNNRTDYSSPVQIPGTTWTSKISGEYGLRAIKTDGTLWQTGSGSYGALAQNSTVHYSSPVQIPGTTWSKVDGTYRYVTAALKTDGTAWMWGHNDQGQLGQNDVVKRSSPVQIPGTTWSIMKVGTNTGGGIKTDGTLWSWGYNVNGALGLNDTDKRSSPVQVPGTEWINLDPSYKRWNFVQDDQTP